MEFFNWKENKEVGTISFEVRIPMKKPKIFMEFFYVSFRKKNIYFWIQQFYFGRKQKYLWKRFYTIKKPLKNRAIYWSWKGVKLKLVKGICSRGYPRILTLESHKQLHYASCIFHFLMIPTLFTAPWRNVTNRKLNISPNFFALPFGWFSVGICKAV